VHQDLAAVIFRLLYERVSRVEMLELQKNKIGFKTFNLISKKNRKTFFEFEQKENAETFKHIGRRCE
jgi:hypothetical protein